MIKIAHPLRAQVSKKQLVPNPYLANILQVDLGPVVQSVVTLTGSLRVISLTVIADSIHNILIFLLKKCE